MAGQRMKFDFDASANRFVMDANDFDTSLTVTDYLSPVLTALIDRPGTPLLVFRDRPTTGMLDWDQIRASGIVDPLGVVEALRGRKIAGVLGSESRYAVGRQLAAVANSLEINYRPFLAAADAIAWLESEEE